MKKNSQKYRSFKGFTLIELLISLAIFIVFIGIVSTTYVSIVRSQRQANDVRKVYSDVRNFVDMVTTEVRLGTIDYDCYSQADLSVCSDGVMGSIQSGRSHYLALIRKDGLEKTTFFYDSEAKTVKMEKKIKNAAGWMTAPGYEEGFQPVFSSVVGIESLSFAISPDVNPYAKEHYAQNEKQFQPKVTLFMTVKSNQKSPPSEFRLNFQTTISSRVYSRSV